MKKKPAALYVAMNRDGSILLDGDDCPFVDTAKKELVDRVNDLNHEYFEVWRFLPTSIAYRTPSHKPEPGSKA